MLVFLFMGLAVLAQSSQVVPTGPAVPSVVVQIPAGGDENCLANYIVKQCLSSEGDKLASCSVLDYSCICYASQAIATCYNNCPNDTRAPQATQSMSVACALAAQYSSTLPTLHHSTASSNTNTVTATATATGTATATETKVHTTSFSDKAGTRPTDGVTSSASGTSASKTNGAGEKRAGDVVGVMAFVAGVVAVAL
ncbi:hypothetical protein E4U13_005281 [Claviceps humidiphila]|uniref:GPI anchored serine-threonine rich protein n=1 Tax=Claviceps humidiphila TaxID=1294629 RepID=A0A9P7TV95_9HYPO|nr:hypothetical protein E4U13_005281 [Claviceps humidiphila]